jgi:hypothetical protein
MLDPKTKKKIKSDLMSITAKEGIIKGGFNTIELVD